MARGDHGEAIFKDDVDRNLFLKTLSEVVDRTGWIIHAYVLMTNHYHFLIETPEPNLVSGMTWFQGAYAQRYNARHRLRGHLFQGRYKALVIESEEKEFLDRVGTYIHLNPARAGLVRVGQDPVRAYPWSSYPAYLISPRRRPRWLKAGAVLWSAGIKKDSPSGRRAYENYVEEKAGYWNTKSGKREFEKEWSTIRKGWVLGHQDFRDRLLEIVDGVIANRPATPLSGIERKDRSERKARDLLVDGLELFAVSRGDLLDSPKGSVEKRVLAWFIKKYTTASLRWLSENLNMGHISNISAMLGEVERDEKGTYRRLKNRIKKTLK